MLKPCFPDHANVFFNKISVNVFHEFYMACPQRCLIKSYLLGKIMYYYLSSEAEMLPRKSPLITENS